MIHFDLIHIDSQTPSETIKKLSRHTYKEDSLMKATLLELYHEKWRMWPDAPTEGYAYMLNVDGKLVGWALVFCNEDKPWNLHVWVTSRNRRKGYGSLLVMKAKNHIGCQKFEVKKHDKRSYEFFSKSN